MIRSESAKFPCQEELVAPNDTIQNRLRPKRPGKDQLHSLRCDCSNAQCRGCGRRRSAAWREAGSFRRRTVFSRSIEPESRSRLSRTSCILVEFGEFRLAPCTNGRASSSHGAVIACISRVGRHCSSTDESAEVQAASHDGAWPAIGGATPPFTQRFTVSSNELDPSGHPIGEGVAAELDHYGSGRCRFP